MDQEKSPLNITIKGKTAKFPSEKNAIKFP
jgi:YHS domain-containing protein